MGGPWEKYQQKIPQAQDGPWAKYGKKEPQTSALQAGAESFANAATLGYLPQAQALASKLVPDAGAEVDEKLRAQGFTVQNAPEKTYIENRDENIARMDLQKKEHPYAAGAGTVAGTLASIVGTGGLGTVAKGANLAQRVAAAAKAGGVLGAVSNPGDKEGEIDLIQADERAKNAGVGIALGAGWQILAEGAGVVANKASGALKDYAAKKAFRALGRNTPTQAQALAKSGQDVVIGRELLNEKAIPVLGTTSRISKRVDAIKEKLWTKVDDILSSSGDDAIVDGTEAGLKILKDPELAVLRDAGETASVNALEDAAEQLAAGGKSMSLKQAQKIKVTLDEKINFNKLSPGPAQEARMAKRTAIRDTMDEAVSKLSGEKGELKGAFKKYGNMAKASEVLEREAGRVSNNRMVSLTDTIAAAGGLAVGDNPTEKAVFGLLLGALNKGGRKFGNSMQARGADALANQLAKIPKFAQMAEQNPAGFAAAVERMSEKLRGQPLQPKFAQEKEKKDFAENKPKRGEDAWIEKGFQKLGLTEDEKNELLKSKNGKRLLIQASDLSPGSKALQNIKDQLQKDRKPAQRRAQ